jgi:hypothetical protein
MTNNQIRDQIKEWVLDGEVSYVYLSELASVAYAMEQKEDARTSEL